MISSACTDCGAMIERCNEWLYKAGYTCCETCMHPMEPDDPDFTEMWRHRIKAADPELESEQFGKAVLGMD